MDRIHHHESFKPTLGPFRHPQGPERINFPPLKSLSGRKAPERPWSQVPASKTFSAQRVIYCDNKDSFMNIKHAHSSRNRLPWPNLPFHCYNFWPATVPQVIVAVPQIVLSPPLKKAETAETN